MVLNDTRSMKRTLTRRRSRPVGCRFLTRRRRPSRSAADVAVPVGVGAAIYLVEYAKPSRFKDFIQTNIYNLAGVPSIVYGVFGLGFFVYVLGGSLDALFYPEAAPAPVFGTPGLMWASLTLAILTLPVVIVATSPRPIPMRRSMRSSWNSQAAISLPYSARTAPARH